MKTLILMRHGQAEFSAESDFQRSLTETGREQVLQSARELSQAKFTVQKLLCSPLLRAKQSAQLVGNELGIVPQEESVLDGRLSAASLLDFAQEQLQEADCVMLVGHNPNISLAAGVLSGNYLSFRAGDCAAFDWTDPRQPKLIFRKIS